MSFEKDLHKAGEGFRRTFDTYRLICDVLRDIKKYSAYGMSPELETFVFVDVINELNSLDKERILRIWKDFQLRHTEWRDSKRLREILKDREQP